MSTRVVISKRLVLINSASSVVNRVLNVTVLLWLNQYLLKRITPEEYSIYPVIMAAVVFVPLLTSILTSGIGRFIVEAYAKGDEQRVTQIVSTILPLLMGAAILVLSLGWTFAWYIDRVLTIEPSRVLDARIMMALMMFSAAVRLPASVFGVGLYVRQKYVLSNAINVCVSCARIALLLFLLLNVSTRVLWVVVATVSTGLCGSVVSIIISRRLVPALRFRRKEIRWSLLKNLISFGTWYFIGQVAGTIHNAADALILNKLGTPLDVTCFHLGSFPQRQIQSSIQTLVNPITPALTAMHAVEEDERLGNAFARVGRFSLWLSGIAIFPCIVFHREIVLLYIGSEYQSAGTVIWLLLVGLFVSYGHLILWDIAHATNQLNQVVKRTILLECANLGLTLFLVGWVKMGAIGSALSTAIISTSSILVFYPLAFRMVKLDPREWFRETGLPGVMPGVAALPIWIVLQILFRIDSWMKLGACFASGLVVYSAVLMRYALRPKDRVDLSCLVSKVMHKKQPFFR